MFDFSKYKPEELNKLRQALDTIHFFGASTIEMRQELNRELQKRNKTGSKKGPETFFDIR